MLRELSQITHGRTHLCIEFGSQDDESHQDTVSWAIVDVDEDNANTRIVTDVMRGMDGMDDVTAALANQQLKTTGAARWAKVGFQTSFFSPYNRENGEILALAVWDLLTWLSSEPRTIQSKGLRTLISHLSLSR